MQREITPNEDHILQAVRAMKPMDRLIITKKSTKSEQDFEMKTEQVYFFFKGEIK